ncbi:MAG: hypothetical protein NWQ31_04355 [Polaribacter sp.]|nr:hypothetical protein [Polaribacter sp.]
MKKIYSILFIVTSLFLFTSCEDETPIPLGTTLYSFEGASAEVGVEQGGEKTSEFKFYAALMSNSARTIDVMVVSAETTLLPAAYSVPASVTIPANSNVGILSVNIKDSNLNPDGDTLTVEFLGKEGEYTGHKMTINVSQLCPNNGVKLKLNLTFDAYPEEVAWEILDSNSAVVMVGSPNHVAYAGEYSGMAGTLTILNCLPSGTYTLVVKDDYADGGTAFEILGNGVAAGSLAANAYTDTTTVTFSL